MKSLISLSIILCLIVLPVSGSVPTQTVKPKTVESQAKMDAKRDADSDFHDRLRTPYGCLASHRSLWTSYGCLASSAGIVVGGLRGPWDFEPKPVEEEIAEMCAYAGIGFLFAIGTAYATPIDLNPGRLMGKSPEYVDVYTKTYKSKTRELRLISTAIGAVIPPSGCTLMMLSVD